MNEQSGRGDLQLDVTDFGPIVEAKIDLRPLTVFVGPSNTGKSYLAILIYALHRVFAGDAHLAGSELLGKSTDLFDRVNNNLFQRAVDDLLKLEDSLSRNSEMRDSDGIILTCRVADALRSGFDSLTDDLSREVERCFGVDKSGSLIRRGRTDTSRVVIGRRISSGEDFVQHTMSLGREPAFKTTVPAESRIPVDFSQHRQTLYSEGEIRDAVYRSLMAMEIFSSIGNMVLPSLVNPLNLRAFYLPAGRTGLMQALNVIVSALIAGAPAASRMPGLSQVLADFLRQLIEIDLTEPTREESERDRGKSIEEVILRGSVRIDRSSHIGYPHFVYRPRGWKEDLTLANASSMVSELAPVVLYLRHMVKPGNVLIVEEPESHLHPAMQVEFMRQLASIVQADIRVIVTTHSEWLLEELANIVRRSELPKEKRGKNIALCPDQVGAWLFKPMTRRKGSIVREIALDESGLYPSGYYKVASELHNEWADIASRIEDES